MGRCAAPVGHPFGAAGAGLFRNVSLPRSAILRCDCKDFPRLICAVKKLLGSLGAATDGSKGLGSVNPFVTKLGRGDRFLFLSPGFAGGEGIGVRGRTRKQLKVDLKTFSPGIACSRWLEPPHPHPLSPAKPGEEGRKSVASADRRVYGVRQRLHARLPSIAAPRRQQDKKAVGGMRREV